jgi:hypothetical protein
MRHRLARVVLGATVLLAAPMAAPSHAWSCQDVVSQTACFAVGTACRTWGDLGGNTQLCTFG